MEKSKIYINFKERPIKRKTVLGPLFRLSEKLYLLVSIVVPSPQIWRVEPHIIYDKSNELISYKGEGEIIEITGNVILAKHENVEKLLFEGYKEKIYPSYHLAPWGLPVLVPPLSAKSPEKDFEAALYGLGIWKVVKWVKDNFINSLEIVVINP